MFCPKCSQAQVSEKERFCKRCGCRLDLVKELIDEDVLANREASSLRRLPGQRDISIGALLMFIGGVVGILWGYLNPGPDTDVLPQVFLLLGFTLGFILLLFQPLLGGLRSLFSETKVSSAQIALQRDGINLGAILMFVGILKAWVLATVINDASQRPPLILAMMALMLLLLFVVRPLVQGVYKLFFKTSSTEELTQDELLEPDATRELLPANSIPAQSWISSRPQSGDMVQRPSVTEKTTDLLEE